jgi:hypothetical protein
MKIDGNTPVSLSLPLETVQTILDLLGTQPYNKVVQTVASIQKQTSAHLQALTAPVDTQEEQP